MADLMPNRRHHFIVGVPPTAIFFIERSQALIVIIKSQTNVGGAFNGAITRRQVKERLDLLDPHPFHVGLYGLQGGIQHRRFFEGQIEPVEGRGQQLKAQRFFTMEKLTSPAHDSVRG